MQLLSLLFIILLLSGCTCYQDPDFNKPLIILPQDAQQNTNTHQNEKTKPKSEQDKVWIETKRSKLWVSPYVDENGDLVEGHYKNIVTEQGHWDLKGNYGKQ